MLIENFILCWHFFIVHTVFINILQITMKFSKNTYQGSEAYFLCSQWRAEEQAFGILTYTSTSMDLGGVLEICFSQGHRQIIPMSIDACEGWNSFDIMSWLNEFTSVALVWKKTYIPHLCHEKSYIPVKTTKQQFVH